MDRFFQYYSRFSEIVGPIGILCLVFAWLVALLYFLRSPSARLKLVFVTFGVYMVATGFTERHGFNMPGFAVMSAMALRFPLVIPIALYGVLYTVTGRGSSGVAAILFLLLGLLGIGAAATTENPGVAVPRAMIIVLFWLGLPAFASGVVREMGFYAFMRAWWWFAVIFGLWSVLWFCVQPSQCFYGGTRFRGFCGNPNMYGWFALTCLIPLIWSIFEKSKSRQLAVLLSIWMAVTMIMSGSRAATFAFFPAFVVVVLWYGRSPVRWITVGVLISIAVLFVQLFVVPESVLDRFQSMDTTGRMPLWIEALERVPEAPFLGHGLGWSDSFFTNAIFNSYLIILCDFGLLGSALLLGVFLYIPLRAIVAAKYLGDRVFQRSVWLVASYVFGMLINAVGESWFAGPGGPQLPMFLTMLGVLEAVTNISLRERMSQTPRSRTHGERDRFSRASTTARGRTDREVPHSLETGPRIDQEESPQERTLPKSDPAAESTMWAGAGEP